MGTLEHLGFWKFDMNGHSMRDIVLKIEGLSIQARLVITWLQEMGLLSKVPL